MGLKRLVAPEAIKNSPGVLLKKLIKVLVKNKIIKLSDLK